MFNSDNKKMSNTKTSSLAKIGYIETLPEGADINDYESLIVTKKDGGKNTLYKLSSKVIDRDDTSNFNKSWDIFNSYLN